MKAVMRPGGGDSTPSEGDQVLMIFFLNNALFLINYSSHS